MSGQPVREIMDSWILQGGYPLVTAEGDTLAQSPFAYTPPLAGEESAIGERWRVPVLLRPAAGGATERLMLGSDSGAVPPGTIVNAGGWGVYRVAYEDGPGPAARLALLDPLERSNLMADTWALVLAGRTGLERFLALAAALGQEDEPGIYSIVTGALGLCDRVVTDDDRPALERAVQALLGQRAADLGWEPVAGEGERVPTLRSLLLAGLGTIGADPQIRTEAARRFDRSGTEPIDPDLEGAVLQSVAAQLRPGDYEAMLERYRKPSTPQEELRYLMALAAFPDVDLALRTFELARTEVRTQNGPYLVASLLGNRVAGAAVWARIEEEWDSLLERFPVNSHSRMLDGARALCGDPAVAERRRAILGRSPAAQWPAVGRPDAGAAPDQRGVRRAHPTNARRDLVGRRPAATSVVVPSRRRPAPGSPGLPAGLADAGKVPVEPARHRHRLRAGRGGRAPGQDDDRHPGHGQPLASAAGVVRRGRGLLRPRDPGGGGRPAAGAAPPPDGRDRHHRRSSSPAPST